MYEWRCTKSSNYFQFTFVGRMRSPNNKPMLYPIMSPLYPTMSPLYPTMSPLYPALSPLLDELTSSGQRLSDTASHTAYYVRTPHAVKTSLQRSSDCHSWIQWTWVKWSEKKIAWRSAHVHFSSKWGEKAENFQIDLLTRITILYENKIYQKKQNYNMFGGLFYIF